MILALTILAGAMAVLGEVSRLALRNADGARDLARAQLLAESKLAEIQAGIASHRCRRETAFDTSTESLDPAERGWLVFDQHAIDRRGRADLGPRDGHPRSAGRPASGEVLARALAAGPQLRLHAAHARTPGGTNASEQLPEREDHDMRRLLPCGLYAPGSDPGDGSGRGGPGTGGRGHPRPPGGGRKKQRPGRGSPTRADLAATDCRRSPQCGPLPAAAVVFLVFSAASGQTSSSGTSSMAASSGTSNSSSTTTPLSGGIYGTAQAIQIETARRPRATLASLQTAASDPSQPARLSDIRVVSYGLGAPVTVDMSQQSSPVDFGHRPLSPRAGSGRVLLRLAKWPDRRIRSGNGTACPGGGRFPAHLLRRHGRHDE